MFLLLALAAGAAPLPGRTAAAEPGFTPRMASAVDRLARNEVSGGLTPGIAIGIIEDGRIVYARGFGKANAGKNVSAQPDTEFYVGDITRQFTAAAALMLSQDGKLKLDDKVTKYVPELSAVPPASPWGSSYSKRPACPTTQRPPVRATLRVRLKPAICSPRSTRKDSIAAPGAAYADNPINYLVAGIVIERASGKPLQDFLQQRIFFPLVMNRSFLAGDTGISQSRAAGYTHSHLGRILLARGWDPAWLQGDRGLVTTIYDLAKWDIEMPILLRVDAERTMFEPNGSNGLAKYGMGWVIDQRGGKRFVPILRGQIPAIRPSTRSPRTTTSG